MKEIWIKLELCIKSYEFSIFRDFFQIFSELILIFHVKNELNKCKKGFLFRAGLTWMRRGTQGHVAAPRGPMRRLRGKVTHYLYLHI